MVALATIGVFVACTPALAYDEYQSYPASRTAYAHHDTSCYNCHAYSSSCVECHFSFPGQGQGPHAPVSTTTRKCRACHTLHSAATNFRLLPRNTIKATCETCHDGTGGKGVYGAIAARGLTPGGRHRVDATSTVPGGDATTGGSATMTFLGPGGTLTCTDCHSPHGRDTVANFVGDRQRVPFALWGFSSSYPHVTLSSKLLRKRPSGATTSTAEYGSDWCLACHKGRVSGGMVRNHPVDSRSVVTTPFTYGRVQVLASNGPTSVTTTNGLGGWNRLAGDNRAGNRGYVMPYPRTARQTGHFPICMQCHEDTRDVGDLQADGRGLVTSVTITSVDGTAPTDNPRFQNFPHETVATRLLVETDDDLCLNCHPPAMLP